MAIKGRMIYDNEYLVISENISLLNKSRNNILKTNNIWYINSGEIMLHIGKYFGYIMRGAGAILFYPFQTRKYVKEKDKYSLKERYDFVKSKADRVLIKYLGAKLEIEGLEKLDNESTYLFVPNHQGLLDPLCLMNIFDSPLIFVSKKEVRKLPIVGKINYVIDSIFLDRESPRDALNMVKSCKNYLNNHINVVIFPEGTRSKDKEVTIHTYKAGAFKCAYGTGAKIVPVVMDGSYLFLTTKKKNKTKTIKIKFLDPICREQYEEINTTELAQKIEDSAKKVLNLMRK